jgi:hypothetical protein
METERETTKGFGGHMLKEEEFTKRYTGRLIEIFQENAVQQWMKDIAPDAYEMWLGDDPEAATPEDMADEEADEMRRNG